MADTTPYESEMNDLIANWLDSTMSFWKNMQTGQSSSSQGETFSFDSGSESSGGDDGKFKTYKTWETSLNNFTSIIGLMMAPENREALVQSTATLAEEMMESVGESLENIGDFQGQLLQSFAKFSEYTKAYNYDDLDHSAFEAFRDFYEAELQKYLKIPKIGLPRESQEQLTQLVDRSNIFTSHLVELVYLFSLPFEKTNRAFQERTRERLKKGEFGDDLQQEYKEWIKTLESHFMELLKSTEYTHVLNNTITSLAAYKDVKKEVMAVVLKDMQVPSNKEMDEVYKELYLMKKKVKALTREVEDLRREVRAKDAG